MRQTRMLALTGAMLLLAGCQTQPQPAPSAQPALQPARLDEMVWVRTDGQRGAGNPVLQAQYELDVAACPGAAQRSPAASECMRPRGYILVPASQAEAVRQQFAARPVVAPQ